MYWSPEVDLWIEEYNKADGAYREEIFNEFLYAPLAKMVENICNTFKFPYCQGSAKSIQDDCLTHVVCQLSKYSPEKGKSFSYFSFIAKNYFIQLNTREWKRSNQSQFVAIDDGLDAGDDDDIKSKAVLKTEAPTHIDYDYLYEGIYKWWKKYLDVVVKKNVSAQRKIVEEIVEMFNEKPDLESKAEFYQLLESRLTDINIRSKGARMNFARRLVIQHTQDLITNYLETGVVEKKNYPIAGELYCCRETKREPSGKLSDETVINIIQLWVKADGKLSQIRLAGEFDVPPQLIHDIVRGKTKRYKKLYSSVASSMANMAA